MALTKKRTAVHPVIMNGFGNMPVFPFLAGESAVTVPVARVVCSETAVMLLIIASPALAIVTHVHRIIIDCRGCNPESVRQGAAKLLGLGVRDAHQLPLANQVLVIVVQIDIKAIHSVVNPWTLIFLVLGDMHTTPAALVRVTILLGDVFCTHAFHGLRFRDVSFRAADVIMRFIVT